MSAQPRPFVGRTRELKLLDTLNGQKNAKFLIVYGRRRIGKTRLLTHWAETRNTRVLYWVATQTSAHNLLASFSQAARNFIESDVQSDHRFSYPSWEFAFEQIAAAARQQPFVLILDEFTYALEAAPELASVLQNAWDHHLKNTPLFLVISGSQVHMMQEQTHSARAPLYGRASARLHLRPLPYAALAAFFPQYKPDALVALYAILGGIPAYLELFNPSASLSENIRNVLLAPNSLMQAEALLFLHEQFDEPRNYVAIMEAIANNCRERKDITGYTELPSSSVGRYLNTLVELGIIERRLPVTVKATRSRQGRYHLADPYMRFYYRFIAPRLDQIERYRTAQALQYVQEHLRAFVADNAFEELCREWVSLMGDDGKLPLYPERIGSYWGRDAQLDVFATNEGAKAALIGECKWGTERISKAVIDKLVRQARKGASHLKEPERWTTHLYLFTRAVVTPAAQTSASQHSIQIVRLEQIDQDLRRDL
jgi:hypothetical protein